MNLADNLVALLGDAFGGSLCDYQGSQRQLAESFKVSLAFVRKLTRRYLQTGSVEPKLHGSKAIAKLRVAQLPMVKALVIVNPMLTRGVERTLYRKNRSAGEGIDNLEGCNKSGVD